MRLFKATAVVLTLAFTPTLGWVQGQSQDSQPGSFTTSGNDFLRYCDENSADFAQLTSGNKQTYIVLCDVWVLGIRQGIEMTQQNRPGSPPPSPEAEKANKSKLELLERYGIKPSFTTPAGDMCIPKNVTANQLRLVVVQWMRANPTTLGEPGAWLVYAALTNTYVCPTEKTK